jgi:hypothetical protein
MTGESSRLGDCKGASLQQLKKNRHKDAPPMEKECCAQAWLLDHDTA